MAQVNVTNALIGFSAFKDFNKEIIQTFSQVEPGFLYCERKCRYVLIIIKDVFREWFGDTRGLIT